MDNVVEMRNITKGFPGIIANDSVNFTLRRGEIHALLGENGAGKSTLMSILFGFLKPDSGEIYVQGKKVEITDPNVANDLGIGMVHQHFKLVENFTALENIILGREPKKGLVIDYRLARKKVQEISELYDLKVDLDAKIEDLAVGMQQKVEINKMLYRTADILIFDEPTGVLTPQEIEGLMKMLRKFKEDGKSIIIITHKLKEIKAVADRCTVLRRGKLIDTVDVDKVSESDLAKLMVGRPVSFSVEKKEKTFGDTLLEIKDLTMKDYRGIDVVNHLNLSVRRGEILGVAGIDGNGQSELVQAVTGLKKVDGGHVYFQGEDITHMPVRKRTQLGISHIPQDRHRYGLVLDFDLASNLLLQTYYQEPYTHRGLLQYKKMDKKAQELIDRFDVRCANGVRTIAGSMSGGNQQKAIVAREVDRGSALLVASQPTRGLDVGAIEYIHKQLVLQRDQGASILLVSYELDEIMSLSDRIAVIFAGEIIDIIDAKDADEKVLGLRMAGVRE